MALDHAHKIPCSACSIKYLGIQFDLLYTGNTARGIVQPRLSIGPVPSTPPEMVRSMLQIILREDQDETNCAPGTPAEWRSHATASSIGADP